MVQCRRMINEEAILKLAFPEYIFSDPHKAYPVFYRIDGSGPLV